MFREYSRALCMVTALHRFGEMARKAAE